jgi:hypothetical protein
MSEKQLDLICGVQTGCSPFISCSPRQNLRLRTPFMFHVPHSQRAPPQPNTEWTARQQSNILRKRIGSSEFAM